MNRCIFTTKKNRLAPENQTWVNVKTAEACLITVEPLPRLYDRHNCVTVTGVYQAMHGKEFSILIAKFSSKPVYLIEGQVVAEAAEHPVVHMESIVSHGEMLGVMKTKTVYSQRNKSTRDIDFINKHLEDTREVALSKADENINADKSNSVFMKNIIRRFGKCSTNTTIFGPVYLET